MATRSPSKIATAIKDIQSANPVSKGRLEPLIVDLSDLTTIKPAAEQFLAKESRIDVLVHNAAVMVPPEGTKSAQGYEVQLATHVLGPFLLTRLLENLLLSTASKEPKGSVRVVWVSTMVSIGGPPGGMAWDEKTAAPKVHKSQMENYVQSKVGDVYLAHEYAQRMAENGLLSLVLHFCSI
jgi:retinol dehydrogenase 12